jgi:hypothetical protein
VLKTNTKQIKHIYPEGKVLSLARVICYFRSENSFPNFFRQIKGTEAIAPNNSNVPTTTKHHSPPTTTTTTITTNNNNNIKHKRCRQLTCAGSWSAGGLRQEPRVEEEIYVL